MQPRSHRSIAPVVGALLLLAVVVAMGVAVAAGVGSLEPVDPAPAATLELAATADDDRLVIEHVAGESLDVRALSVRVTVEGEPLDEQPPVPFFQDDGFRGGPTGPFNAESDPTWAAGERAGVRVAETNDPSIEAGDRVAVTISRDGDRVATLETTAE